MGLGPLSQLPVHPTQEPTNSLCSVFTAWSTKAVWMSSSGPGQPFHEESRVRASGSGADEDSNPGRSAALAVGRASQ